MLQVNKYAVIPSAVRYDKSLSKTDILLFGELAAASNAYGVCEEDNGYFAAALRVEPRTISRALSSLEEGGHVERIIEGGKRKIRLITKNLRLPTEVTMISPAPIEDISDFLKEFVGLWENLIKSKIDRPEHYETILRSRLESFSKENLIDAAKNRAAFVNESAWHQLPQNRIQAVSLELLLKDDATVLRWLNAKPAIVEKPILRPFNKQL